MFYIYLIFLNHKYLPFYVYEKRAIVIKVCIYAFLFFSYVKVYFCNCLVSNDTFCYIIIIIIIIYCIFLKIYYHENNFEIENLKDIFIVK